MQANILLLHKTSIPGLGSKVKLLFSESSHVAYQIKGNEIYSTRQANIQYLHTPLTPGVVSKVKTFFFSERGHVAYQIKGNGNYSISISIEYKYFNSSVVS